MSKKKKKKNKSKYDEMGFIKMTYSDSKSMEKEFNKLFKQIKADKINIFEADKKDHKKLKHKKKINKEEAEFLSSMRGIKKRKKVIKNWKKNGVFGKIMDILREGGKAAKTLGKCVASFILVFLSVDAIRDKISTKTLNTLTMIFQFAVSL